MSREDLIRRYVHCLIDLFTTLQEHTLVGLLRLVPDTRIGVISDEDVTQALSHLIDDGAIRKVSTLEPPLYTLLKLPEYDSELPHITYNFEVCDAQRIQRMVTRALWAIAYVPHGTSSDAQRLRSLIDKLIETYQNRVR